MALAGNNHIQFGLFKGDDDGSRHIEGKFENETRQATCSIDEPLDLTSLSVVALALSDLADLNLGSRVLISGGHVLDSRIADLVGGVAGVVTVSLADQIDDESVDAFIGCDLPSLVGALPKLRRGAVIVITCDFDGDERLDLYGTLHRNGLSVRSIDPRRHVIDELTNLVSRSERLMVSKHNTNI